jgi:hypothetical protein
MSGQVQVAHRLWVSTKSAYQWRRRWRTAIQRPWWGGMPAERPQGSRPAPVPQGGLSYAGKYK